MIITEQILTSFGLPIDRSISVETLRTAIVNSEATTIFEAIGFDAMSQLASMTATDPALVGGDVNGKQVAGYNRAAANIAFAHLLVLVDSQATAFGAVKKKDEYSNPIDWFKGAQYAESVGLAMLAELAEAEGWKYNVPNSFVTEGGI